MTRIRTFIAATLASMTPLAKGLCSGLVATATVAAGGAATINENTSITLGIFAAGVAAACTVGIWVGTRVGKLLEMVGTLKRIERQANHLHDRIRAIEKNCNAGCALKSKTQQVIIQSDET
jgi:hypothetical protein